MSHEPRHAVSPEDDGPVSNNVLSRYPAAIYGLVNAVLALVTAFGFSLSAEQVGALLAVTSAGLAFFTHRAVVPLAKLAGRSHPE